MTPGLIENGVFQRAAAAEALRTFLEETTRAAKLDLQVSVSVAHGGEPPLAEVLADLSGRDQDLLLERGGELLQAIEHLALRALRLDPPWQEKILLDSGGYRALRMEELRMMARTAAERVIASRQPLTLNPMSARDRRLVHLALQGVRGIRTESTGAADRRQVVIHPVAE